MTLSLDRVQELITDEVDSLRDLLLEKNRKYGNSAINPTRIFSKSDPVEQIKVRIDDKLSRIIQGSQDEDEDVIKDLVGYFILLRVTQRAQEEMKTPELPLGKKKASSAPMARKFEKRS